MKALESEIGVSLLYRTNKGIELTEQGKLYWAYATEVWLSHQKMEEELRALSFKGSTVRLSLGVVDAFTTTFLPPFLVDFKRRHPEIDLRCFPMTAEEISRQLEKVRWIALCSCRLTVQVRKIGCLARCRLNMWPDVGTTAGLVRDLIWHRNER